MRYVGLAYLVAAIIFVACSGMQGLNGSSVPQSAEYSTPGFDLGSDTIPTDSPVPADTATPGYTLQWQIGDLGAVATDGLCGTGVTFPTPTSAKMEIDFNPDGSCYRSQWNPYSAPSQIWQMTPGNTYEWKFATVALMKVATDPFEDRLVWQIHQYNAGQNGCDLSPWTSLHITTDGSGIQSWVFNQHAGNSAPITYTEGAVDDWDITAKVTNDSSGHVTVLHNGQQVLDESGPVWPTNCNNGPPFWNFGPYDWLMKNNPSHPYMGPAVVKLKFNYMKFFSRP